MIRRWPALVPLALALAATCAAAVKDNVRIKVLESETRSFVLDDSGVPKNCDQVNFDAYCHNSKTTQVTNILLVQVGNDPPFRVSCTIESKWSRCIPLEKGESFDARKDKRGLIIYYQDDKGKVRGQLYTLAAGASMPVVAAAQPPSAPPVAADAPRSPKSAASRPAQSNESVPCSFTTTPAGAEITLDGKYVGSTPSQIAVGVGNHVVEFSLAGFAPWKRDLAVVAGSGAVTVSAALQKTLP